MSVSGRMEKMAQVDSAWGYMRISRSESLPFEDGAKTKPNPKLTSNPGQDSG